MKEKEIKEELKKIKANKHDKCLNSIKTMSIPQPVFTEEETKLCCVNKCITCWRRVRPGNGAKIVENKTLRGTNTSKEKTFTSEEKTSKNFTNNRVDYAPRCCCCNRLSMFYCRCCKFAFDNEENSKSKKISVIETSKSEEKTSTSEKKTKKSTNNRDDYSPKCFCCRWLGMFFCGCCNFPLDDNGNCTCCVELVTVFKSEEEPNTLRARSEYYNILKKNKTLPCVCIKDCLHTSETTEEENLLNELKTDTSYKITVDTIDEIRPRTIYKVKAEVINDEMTELEATSNSDTCDKNKQQNENIINKTSSEKNDEIIKKGSVSEPRTNTEIKGMISQKMEHNKNSGNAGNACTADAFDGEIQQHETSNSNENGNKSDKIVNENEIGACAKPTYKYKVTAFIEDDASKSSLIIEEKKESENQDKKTKKEKTLKVLNIKSMTALNLKTFTTKLKS